jgi:DNA-binding MarR family transcriptional regulator
MKVKDRENQPEGQAQKQALHGQQRELHAMKRELRTQWREHIREQVCSLTGIEDTTGLELVAMIHRLANLYESAEVPAEAAVDLSGPRWLLLLRLMAEEHVGNHNGLTPTGLSHFQNVSKNTISSLLRGLEDQGLIQRAIDPEDKRLFRIQLSERGRSLMAEAAPRRIRYLNCLISELTTQEKEQLFALLGKLYQSVIQNCGARSPADNHAD